MINNSPILTVMIPTYNRMALIKRCLESLKAQTSEDFEVVISDNGSKDGTAEYLKKSALPSRFRIYYSTQNEGSIRNHEKCAENSRTPWVVYVSDDDWVSPDFIETALKVLPVTQTSLVLPGFDSRDEHSVIFDSYCPASIQMDGKQSLLEQIKNPVDTKIRCAGIGGFFMRRENLLELCPIRKYPGAFYFDTIIFWAVAMASGIQTIDRVLYHRTEWSGSTTNSQNNYRNQVAARKLFIKDFENLVKRSHHAWLIQDKPYVLNSLREYRKNTPYTLRRRIGQIKIVRNLLDIPLVKKTRYKLGMIR